MVLALVVVSGCRDKDGVAVTAAKSTTTTSEVTTTTTSSTATTAPTAPTTTRTCRNSYDPACDAFRWDPAPGPNADITTQATVDPEHPKAGQTVTIRVMAADPDASVEKAVNFGWGDQPVGSRTYDNCPAHRKRYGPWTPPTRTRGQIELAFTRTFDRPGSYSFGYTIYSAVCDQYEMGHWVGDAVDHNPYASEKAVTRTVEVTEA